MRNYLERFGEIFRIHIIGLIGRNIEVFESQHKTYDLEILHHALFCKSLAKKMIPRSDENKKSDVYKREIKKVLK